MFSLEKKIYRGHYRGIHDSQWCQKVNGTYLFPFDRLKIKKVNKRVQNKLRKGQTWRRGGLLMGFSNAACRNSALEYRSAAYSLDSIGSSVQYLFLISIGSNCILNRLNFTCMSHVPEALGKTANVAGLHLGQMQRAHVLKQFRRNLFTYKLYVYYYIHI